MIGFTCGVFDLFHAGHCLALKEAALQCTYLIVGLQTDPTIDRPAKNKPVQTVEERRIQLQSCKYVDEIFVYETEAQLYKYLDENYRNIEVRFLGADWEHQLFTGCCLPIKTVFTSRNHSYSSTELRQRIVNDTLLSGLVK